MKTVRMKKNKHLIFLISSIIVFIILITVAYNSYSSTKEYFLGDTNGDNEITLSDELLLLRHIYSVKTDTNNNWRLTEDALVNADINEDKKIDISDVLYIKRYLLAQKDTSIAEKHTEWTKLCRKTTKEVEDIIKSYTLAIKPGEQTYTRETKTTMTVTAPEVSYTVTFDGNGGNSPESIKSIRNFSNWTLSGAGNIEDKKASPTTYTFGDGDATLTANYNKEGNSIVLPNANRDEYIVEGWYDSKELKNKIGNVGDSYSPTQDITLYAKWTNQKVEPTSVELNKTNTLIDISENKTEKLTAKTVPENSNYNAKLTWTSSNPSIATVSENGEITGVSNGKTIITVQTENGKSSKCEVTVQTSPTGIALDVTEKTIDLNGEKTFTIKPTIIPSTANVNNTIKVKTSDSNVATVTEDGVVTGIANGSAEITFYTDNGRFATCNVNVVTRSTNITLNKTSVTIDLSGTNTEKLIATTNASGKLNWISSNINVATVSEDGVITGKENGETTITVRDESGESATCEVTVQTSATGLTLDITEQTLDMSLNKTFKLTATVTPATANVNREIQIKSSDSNVATISRDGTVTGLSNGSTVITFSMKNGKEAKCNVTVHTSPTSISLDKTSLNMDSDTSMQRLTATISPETSDIYTGLTWKSSNSSVATVSDGLVTGKSTGTAKITVETENGKTATCDVNVKMSQEKSNLTLNKESITIDLSELNTEKLIATTNASGGLNWSSDNTDVATVSRDGVVTGIANGNATITVIDSDGEIVTCKVTVQTSPTSVTLNATEQTLDLSGNKTFTINANVEPSTSNVNNKIYLESSNPSVATVSSNGVVTGIANGTTTIVARTSNGKEARCNVTVQTSPTGIVLNVTEQMLDLNGTKTFKIVADILPLTANVYNTLHAKSSNASVATVSEDGTVTAISEGNAIITIETENGKSATCNVTVLQSQVSPTNIYFVENKDDDTKYISVKKGESTTVKAITEPSDANSNITYSIISGNSKVASIDSTTGEVTGKQAGVVTIQAKTSNGKTAKIKLNVRIGNEAFDTSKTIKLRANTSESLLYSKAVDFSQVSTIGEASHFQTFAVASSGDIYYSSYPGGTSGTTNTSAKMNISIGHPNETPYKCMTLNYFGHGSGFDLESGSGGGKVWIDSITCGNSSGKYDQGYGITRIQWANKSEYYFAAGTVKLKNTSGKVLKTYENNAGENFIFTTNGELTKNLRAAIDEKNRLMGIKKGNYYYVFDLDEALEISDKTYQINTYIDDYKDCIVEVQAKDLDLIKPLTSFKIPTPTSEDDVTWYAWQGMDLDGDYIYIGEGHYTNRVTPKLTTGKAFVSVFDYMYAYNGNVLAEKKTEVAAVNEEWSASKKLLALMGSNSQGEYNLAQLEGIRVTTQGGVKEMCLGFDSSFESTGKRSANILKYTY